MSKATAYLYEILLQTIRCRGRGLLKKTYDVLEVTFGDKLQKNGIISKGMMC